MIHKTQHGYSYKPFVFPKGFLWGAATSSHQVEGGNENCDWWKFEIERKLELSGAACDQYSKYEEDAELISSLGQNAHRLSLEWSRIEPTPGVFDEEAIEHYRKVLSALKSRGIKVALTIHHFTNPSWLGAEGWERHSVVKHFTRFVDRVVREYDELVDLWITINEPMVFLFMGWQAGKWPPGKKASLYTTAKVFFHLARAHKESYRLIKTLSKKNTPVGIANNCQSFYAYDRRSIWAMLSAYAIEWATNHLFYFWTRPRYHDFLGLNYYFHHRVVMSGLFKSSFLDPNLEQRDRSDMGWELNPDGMFDVLLSLNHYRKPIYITECGVATDSEHVRQRFLVNFIKQVHHGISAGVNVKGFFYWSFMDNFEWADGFTPHFGLVAVDYKTQKRAPRDCAYLYARIIKRNEIDEELFKYFGYRTEYHSKTDTVE